VGQFHDNGGVDHFGPVSITELRREERQRWAQPLAASIDQVPRSRVGQSIGLRYGISEPLLHKGEPWGNGRLERGIPEWEGHPVYPPFADANNTPAL
jgi:hypothetical protein